MKYGYFDDENKEYVITRPDTPKSWSNYLGSTEYGAIITNNAGGYSFYKSGGMGRFTRIQFNSIPMDQPGRYIYLRDDESGDFWSTSWQPVGKPLSEFKSHCHHGTAYTKIISEYSGIKSETLYFVPLGRTFEIWKVKLTNNTDKVRKLSAFTYVELVGNWNAVDDLMNIQYISSTVQMKMNDGIIDHGTNVNIPPMPENFKEKDQGRHSFHALVGAEIKGFDTDREMFIGPYRTYANPIVVERGKCNDFEAYGDNPCATIHADVSLNPGESREFAVIMGVGKASEEGKAAAQEFSDLEKIEEELIRLKEYWHQKMSGFSAVTPDKELDSTINTWGIYNSLITFAWSRAASLIYSGIDRDGLGYRDTVQDFMGVLHAIPELVKERLELMITGQLSHGGAMPVVIPISHHPGKEIAPDKTELRSDDSLWLFNAVPGYVKETGDIEFFNKILPYADKGEATVFYHLKQAIQFSIDHLGVHGLPCGLKADWNDCLKFGFEGESVFVAMQLRFALKEYVEICELLQLPNEKSWATGLMEELDKNIQKHTWDGEWFMRGYRFDGMKFGSKESLEGKIYFNTQSWAIISGTATSEQAETAMQNVYEKLATEYGIALCDPPYTQSDYKIAFSQIYNPGLKENGGIFAHTQGWGVMAETLLGNGNRAYEYLRSYLPAAYNEKAEIREIEPYVICQSTHGKLSPKNGVSRNPWLSGSATWTYYAITQYILGIKTEYSGITIDPCIPSNWDSFQVTRKFRNLILHFTFKNPSKVEKGVKCVVIDGKICYINRIDFKEIDHESHILVIMGKQEQS